MSRLLALLVLLTITGAAFAQTKNTTTIKVYYLNTKNDPNLEDCQAVKPTTRTIPRTAAIARAALDEYLKGATAEEEAKGFTSFGKDETAGALRSINIKAGAAYVNFNNVVQEKLGNATTSCGGGFFTGLEKTLTQFPTIRKVYYAIEGDTNDFYNWVQVGDCPHGKRACSKSNFK